jgi:hypothetical protein
LSHRVIHPTLQHSAFLVFLQIISQIVLETT